MVQHIQNLVNLLVDVADESVVLVASALDLRGALGDQSHFASHFFHADIENTYLRLQCPLVAHVLNLDLSPFNLSSFQGFNSSSKMSDIAHGD